MKIQHLLLLLITATTVVSCAPYPGGQLGSESGSTVPGPTLEKYKKVPMGHADPSGRKNMVVSPYYPYNVIDVSGYRSGDIVGDVSTAIVNPSTGKRELSTAKYFRIP